MFLRIEKRELEEIDISTDWFVEAMRRYAEFLYNEKNVAWGRVFDYNFHKSHWNYDRLLDQYIRGLESDISFDYGAVGIKDKKRVCKN